MLEIRGMLATARVYSVVHASYSVGFHMKHRTREFSDISDDGSTLSS